MSIKWAGRVQAKTGRGRRLRHGLQLLVLALAALWAQTGMAAPLVCVLSGPSSVAVTGSMKSGAASGTPFWISPTQTTRFTCTNADSLPPGSRQDVAKLIYNGNSISDGAVDTPIDSKQLSARVVWARSVVVGVNGTAAGQSVIFNKDGSSIGDPAFGPVYYLATEVAGRVTLDITWHIELLKGSAPTAAGIAALPANANVFRLIGNVGGYPYTNADSPVIRLTGLNTLRLIPTTCSINAANVNLPGVVAGLLSAAGTTAGDKRFSIQLNNCTEGAGGAATNARNVRAYFDGTAVDAASGRLAVDAGGAGNVQVQLLNDNAAQSVINLAGATGVQNVDIKTINGGSVTLPYIARYYATGKATAGAVNTRVNFTVEYP